MNCMKKNVLLITICAILMPCTYARAEYRGGSNPSFVQEGIGYLILSEEARTVAVCGTNDSELTSVRITETVSHEGVDYTVESIADSAFYGHPSLQRVEVALSKTYTSVGYAVFGGCPSLKEVVLGETKDLPYDTFEGSDHIESVSVNCQRVNELFSNKPNLKKIIFGPLVRQVGYLANGGPNILSKRANTSAGRERTIPQGVFYGCSALTEITLPESVKGIGDGCFACCENLETIVIPEHCVIGADAFYGTKWLAGQSDGIVYLNDAVIGYKGEMPENYQMTFKAGTHTIADHAFSGESNLGGVTFSDELENIGNWAFNGCQLEEVTIPGPTTLGGAVFDDALKTLKITHPDSHFDPTVVLNGGNIETLYVNSRNIAFPGALYYSYYRFNKLKTLVMGDSVRRISDHAFVLLSELKDITFSKNLCEVGNEAFGSTAWFDNQPDGMVYTGPVAYAWKGEYNGTSYEFPDGTKSISAYCFCQKENLKQVIIPASVESIKLMAFGGNHQLKEIYMKGAVPPQISTQVGWDTDVTVYVPTGSKTIYEANYAWSKYNIVEYETEGIRSINNEELKMNNGMFDLQGRRVTEPQKGKIYIQKGKKYINK